MFSAVWYRFGKYGTDVNIKEDNDVIVAADGWYGESTCFISAYFASYGLTKNVSVMSTKTWCFFA